MSRTRIKILSYNIHKGFSALNKHLVLKRIKESISTLGANIVFLQEVVGHNTKHAEKISEWPSQSQFEFLADTIWPHYAYGKNAVYTSGHHGNAILSAFPIIQWSNTNISTNPWESRGLLHATIELPTTKQKVHCFCVHLSLLQGGRAKQTITIIDTIKKEVADGAPFILAGDFNDWRHKISTLLSKELGAKEIFLDIHQSYACTYPAAFPMLCLDRIYVRDVAVHSAEKLIGKPWSQLSDHLPLFAEVEII